MFSQNTTIKDIQRNLSGGYTHYENDPRIFEKKNYHFNRMSKKDMAEVIKNMCDTYKLEQKK